MVCLSLKMPLSIEGNRAGRKYQETFRSFRTKGSGPKGLFEPEATSGASTSMSALPRPSSRQGQVQSPQHRSPPGASYLGPLKPSSSHSRASSRKAQERPVKSRQKTPGGRLGLGLDARDKDQHGLVSREKTKSRSGRVKKDRKAPASRGEVPVPGWVGSGGGYEHRPASRSASRPASRLSEKSDKSPATSPGDFEMAGTSYHHNLGQSLESITLSDYMSNLLRKNHNKSRQSTPQSDLGDEDVRPQSVEHLEMQCDIEDSNAFSLSSREGSANGRLRNMLSRGQSRKGRPPTNPGPSLSQSKHSWMVSENRSKDFEMDFRPATASDRIGSRGDYSDPHLSIDTHVTTKEVDLSALSADFFSPTKKASRKKHGGGLGSKRPTSQEATGAGGTGRVMIDDPGRGGDPEADELGGAGGIKLTSAGKAALGMGDDDKNADDAEEREGVERGGLESLSIDYDYPVVGSRRKPQSARAMLEGWQKRMNEMERPPSRQRPPPESLHLYAEGFAARISNVKRPSTAASSSRHRQIRQNDSDPKLFAACYMKKDSQSLRENLRNQNTIKYTSYEGDAIRAPSRRGRKKRVKEAFAKE